MTSEEVRSFIEGKLEQMKRDYSKEDLTEWVEGHYDGYTKALEMVKFLIDTPIEKLRG